MYGKATANTSRNTSRPSAILAQSGNPRRTGSEADFVVAIETCIPRFSNHSAFSRAFEWKFYRCKSCRERQAIPLHCGPKGELEAYNSQCMIRVRITGGMH